jgi:hypothetical protein
MLAKCSLTGYNPFLQLLGLLFMAFILVIVVIYYLQVYHSSILEKYENAAVNPLTLKFNTFSDTATTDATDAAAATTLEIYPGAKLDLVGLGTKAIADAITADSGDTFTLRDCKVYFTDDIDSCDKQQDTTTKTCSYKLDGWQEFNTYTDKNGGTITYEKKKYKTDATGELINAHLTSKCFKEFDREGSGNARGFEYKQNALITYDAKGTTNNGVLDANTFGGKKYTSIKFMNSTNAGDNLAKVIDSICSVKYDTIAALNGKVFYKFIFDTNKNITAIEKVKFNDNQTGIVKIQNDALTDFATLGSHGLRFDDSGQQLQIFINDTGINKNMNIYKFNYLTNICDNAQIKDYMKHASQNVNINKFVSFEALSSNKFATIAITNIDLIDQATKNTFNRKNGTAVIDYKDQILAFVKRKEVERENELKKNSRENVASYDRNIVNKNNEISAANTQRETLRTSNNSFTNVMNLTNSGGVRIFNYQRGYRYTEVESQVIPTISNFETIFKENKTFTIPAGGIVCDILVVGGGGGGVGGGGGAGALVAMIGYRLPAGSCSVVVGAGGTTSKGGESTISVNGSVIFKAVGGGSGGNLISYSDFNRNNGGNGGCGGGGYGPRGRGGSVENYSCLVGGGMVTPGMAYGDWTCRGNNGGNADMNWSNHCGGGGGIGAVGKPYSSYSVDGAPDGGAGLDTIAIGGRSYNLKNHFAEGQAFGHNNNGYIGGGGGGRLSTSYATDIRGQGGVGGGGKSNAGWWGNMVNAENGAPNTGAGGGGGGYGSTGGSGIVIIKVANGAMPSAGSSGAAAATPTAVSITHPNTDEYYKQSPWPGYVYIPNNRVQTGIVTAFVYLQAGYYRFRADIGGISNNKISYAELVIYDESNRSGANYSCKKVFKYINSGGKLVPAHLREYIYITSNKFYKLAYTFKYVNEDKNNYMYENFNLYAKFLDNPRNDRNASSVSLTNSDNSDGRFMTDYLGEINDNYNNYLFSGTEVYDGYNNSEIANIFSAITYNGNNTATNLTNYLNNNLDYFRISALTRERDAQQQLKDGASSLLTTTLATDGTLINYKKLHEDITNINYTGILPLKTLTLITGTSFTSIFGDNKETSYLTYDKVSNTNNLANPSLTPTVFVEAL